MDSKTIAPESVFSFLVLPEDNNIRLDVFAAKQFKNYSRSYFQKIINENGILINGININKSSWIIKENDQLIVTFPKMPEKPDLKVIDKDLGIELLFEHSDFLIVYKPAGVLVHKANSNSAQVSLVDWLLLKFNEISNVGLPERPGIVHRLDLLTSGILIVTRNNFAHMTFSDMFKNRQIKKTYLAIVEGHPETSGSIDYSITRHASGTKMATLKNSRNFRNARESLTHYKTLKYFKDSSLVEVSPVTGRTHQIRVHFSAIGHSLIGDVVYGKKSKLIDRQALHAYSLEFEYEGQKYKFEKEMPEDMKLLVENLSK